MSKKSVVWTADALRKLRAITDYIAERNPPASRRLEEAFVHCVQRIRTQPLMYRQGRVAGTREAVVHPNYLMIYQIQEKQIVIVSVVHARQQYP